MGNRWQPDAAPRMVVTLDTFPVILRCHQKAGFARMSPLGTYMQSFAKFALWMIACVSFLAVIVLALIVLDMFQHPRGVGMEWLAGPLVGFFALVFLAVGVVC